MKAMNKIKYAALALVALVVGACTAEEFSPNETLVLKRCLQPMNLNARVSASLGDVVTFSWDVTKDADSYALTIYSDGEVYLTEPVAPTAVPYQKKLDADKTYTFSVQATSESKEASKVAEYGKTFKTFAVKDNLYMKVADRKAASVSFSWSKDVTDFEEVDRIEVTLPGSDEVVATHTLTADEIVAAAATVDGLEAGKEYVFTLYFLSASRGQVNAWTAPSTEGFTEVSTVDALKNAVKTQGAQILLKMEGSPYDVEAMEIGAGFTLVGEEAADGSKPVLQGEIQFADTWAGTNVYFEGVEFNGGPTATSPSGFGFAIQNKNGGTVDGKAIGNITYKNCVITGYSKGLMYEWGKAMVLGDVVYDSCEISNINADGTGGGDVFDIRGATSMTKLAFVNNTIFQGMRTFIRIDAGSIDNLVVENNTIMNLNFVDNTNNAGIFGLQIVPGATSFKNNLVLHMVEKATLGSANAKYKTPADISLAASNNWYFDVVATYFTDTWAAAATGFSALEEDPCYNAAAGLFNLNPDSVIADKKVGASKWWTPYVEEPEDLTQPALDGAHTWDLSNAKYFSGTIKKEMVRDGILLSGSEQAPIVAADGVLRFDGAAITNRQGVPTTGYVAFKVTEPGSVVARAAGEGTAHIIVAVQPVEGGDLIIKGGVSPVADAPAAQKILISDITAESWVYIYPSGPVSLAQLAWSKDMSAVNTALPAPAPKAAPASFTAGEATAVTITWEPVENAGSYSVVFSGKTYAADGLSYTIEGKTTGMLDPGSYAVKVFANPGKEDIYNTQSEAGVATFAVLPAGGSGESSEFIVASVEDLLAAIDAGKDFITLKYSDTPYEIGALTLVAPLHLKGQESDGKKTAINASITLSGAIGGSVVFRNLDITSSSAGTATSFLIDDKTADNAPVLDTVAVYDSNLHGTKALYDNSGKAVSKVQYVIFKGNIITDSSAGADYIDLRAGAHHNFVFENNTVANSCRTVFRTDATHEMNTALIKNNTFYKVATNSTSKDNNGILHIRSAAGSGLYSYELVNNFFYSILIDPANLPSHANGFPKLRSASGITPSVIRNNYFYNCEEDLADYSFWKNLSKEEATREGGAILPADPCKDAANLDFTLTNGVMMNAGVGDPRWNAMAGSTPSSEITVADVDGFLTAISAGKKTITLDAGVYDLTAVTEVPEVSAGKLTLTTPLNLIGKEGTVFKGGFIFKEGVTSFSMKNVAVDGAKTVDNVFEIADAAVVMNSFSVKNSSFTGVKNRLFYMNVEGSVNSVEFENVLVTGVEGGDFTSGDFIDVRKGTMTALKVKNSTFANAIRTFARIDAVTVCASILVENNTFYNNCFVDSKDNNGIFHVRSSSALAANAIDVKNNLFVHMQRAEETPSKEQGFPKLVSKGSSELGLPNFSHNYFAEVLTTENNNAAEYSWWAYSPQETATAGYGVVLTAPVFKDAANGDFTVVHGLVASEKVGDPRWIKSAPAAGEAFKVADADELATAIEAGKKVIALTGATYDLTALPTASAGVITLSQGLTLKGVAYNGKKPEVLGGFKLAMTEGDFILENVRLNGVYDNAGAEAKVGNMIDIDAAAVIGTIGLRNSEIYGYANRLVSGSGKSSVDELVVAGNLVHDFGTSGDFIDFRNGSLGHVNIQNNTFWNGIRTFLRVDAAVNNGGVLVENNTFYNLCAVDNKDNNGILHVRSTSGVAPAALGNAARRVLVRKNIFAAMHRAEETPSKPAGFPKLVSTASETIKHPYISDNLFFDIDTAEPYSWWNTMAPEDIEAAGQVLTETPFEADPATGKFTVKAAYKGYGDTRW